MFEQRVNDEMVVEVRVWYDGDPGWLPEVEPREAVVQGHAAEPFVDALCRTFGPPPEGNRYSLVEREGPETLAWLGEITTQVTLGDASRFADGSTLQVDVLGRGGDAIPLMWELVEAGLTIVSLAQGGRAASRAVRAARARMQRAMAQEWVDQGDGAEAPMHLRQYVFAQREWVRSDFDRTFALDREAGSRLLRQLGYRKVATDPERWEDGTTVG